MACKLCHPPYQITITREMLAPSPLRKRSYSPPTAPSALELDRSLDDGDDDVVVTPLSPHGHVLPPLRHRLGPDRCIGHRSAIKVFSQPDIWAGSFYTPRPPETLVIDLVGRFDRDLEYHGLNAPEIVPMPRVRIRWFDFSAPKVTRKEWERITGAIKAQGSSFVLCQGGHGRTGTALAILGCLLHQIPEHVSPVTWVREKYCREAIESLAQISYIRQITGRAAPERPR